MGVFYVTILMTYLYLLCKFDHMISSTSILSLLSFPEISICLRMASRFPASKALHNLALASDSSFVTPNSSLSEPFPSSRMIPAQSHTFAISSTSNTFPAPSSDQLLQMLQIWIWSYVWGRCSDPYGMSWIFLVCVCITLCASSTTALTSNSLILLLGQGCLGHSCTPNVKQSVSQMLRYPINPVE